MTGVPSGRVHVDDAARRRPGAGDVRRLDARPAELLDPAVLEDPGAVVEEPVAVGLLLDDQADAEVVEGDRHVEPPHPVPGRVGRAAGRLGLAGGADAPRPVAGADPAVGRHGDSPRRRSRSCPPTSRTARTAARRAPSSACRCASRAAPPGWPGTGRASGGPWRCPRSPRGRPGPPPAAWSTSIRKLPTCGLSRSWSIASLRCTAVCSSPRRTRTKASLVPRLG